MTYDAFVRPKQHTRNGFTTTYTFNALDQRVKKYYGGGNTIRYVYAGQNTLLAERFKHGATGVSTWSNYLWLGGQPVGLVRNNTLYWIHADHLGRPEMATNASGQRVWRAANWAFNRSVLLDQIDGLNLGFPGQQWDSESNLWHNGFRDYEPTLGRYIQSDPIGLVGGVSTYGYVGGNPLASIDTLGLVGYVCQKGNNIGIAIPINFQGANPAQIAKISEAIQKAWSGQFGRYSVSTVVLSRTTWDRGNSNSIAIASGTNTSWVHATDKNWGQWYIPGK